MSGYNPIKSSSGGPELPIGSHLFTLVDVEIGERAEVKWQEINGAKVPTKTGNKVECLKFRFSHMHPTLGECRAMKMTSCSNAANSSFVGMLQELAPGALNDQIREDRDMIWNFAQNLIGNLYILSIVPKDGYNNINGIVPAPPQAPVYQPTPQAAPQPIPQQRQQLSRPAQAQQAPVNRQVQAFNPNQRFNQQPQQGIQVATQVEQAPTIDDDNIPF